MNLNNRLERFNLYKTESYTGTKADAGYFASITLPAGKYVYWSCGQEGQYGAYLKKADGTAIGYVAANDMLTLSNETTIRVHPATSDTTWERCYICFLRIA